METRRTIIGSCVYCGRDVRCIAGEFPVCERCEAGTVFGIMDRDQETILEKYLRLLRISLSETQ